MAIKAKMKSARGRVGTVRSVAVAPQGKVSNLQKSPDKPPFQAGTMGLGVLSVPPKPVKR